MIVLKHYYNGTPKYYKPYKYTTDGNNLISDYIEGHNITITNASTGNGQYIPIWKTVAIPVSPGAYEINITYSYNGSVNNKGIYNLIISTSGNTVKDSTSYCVKSSNLGGLDKEQVLHFYYPVYNFTDEFTIFAQLLPNTYWNGTISVSAVSISQIAYAKML